MDRSILSVLKKRKLSSINRSISFTETTERLTHEHAEITKKALSGPQAKEAPEYLEELHMRSVYLNILAEYNLEGSVRTHQRTSKRSMSLWTRVVQKCNESGVEPEVFVRAQFEYFHRCFRKAPEPVQCTTDNALIRAVEYYQKNVNAVPQKVVRSTFPMERDFSVLMKEAEERMRSYQRAQNWTREQVYINLVLPGFVDFPKEYLAADPVYLKAKASYQQP